ncbi:hypothetical protein K466DRAFT_659466 [Polyporus arcularius HHB13444]|uniref:Uncharacterized protein n=1 Tax=Polyporus arcularius HHB13444 TaxID=1314778 RepID=A0A5C3PRS2_9APHY|nr:hypothetical protein K466DRAFT_659466 [Polyporus arcularius HHB13444]
MSDIIHKPLRLPLSQQSMAAVTSARPSDVELPQDKETEQTEHSLAQQDRRLDEPTFSSHILPAARHPYRLLVQRGRLLLEEKLIEVPNCNTWWETPLEDCPVCDVDDVTKIETKFLYSRYESATENDFSSAPEPISAPILVREEYLVALDEIDNSYRQRGQLYQQYEQNFSGGLLIMGWDGIGKSTFIRYAMTEIVSRGDSVLFYDGKILHAFCKGNYVSATPPEYVSLSIQHPELCYCILLCDLAPGESLPVEFLCGYNYIVATPTSSDREILEQRRHAKVFYLKPWTWPEFYAVVMSHEDCTPRIAWDAYTRGGPTTHLAAVFSASIRPMDRPSAFEEAVKTAIDGMVSHRYGFTHALLSEFSQLVHRPSVVFMSVPLTDMLRRTATLLPPSPMISSMLLDALQFREDVNPKDLFGLVETTQLGLLLQQRRNIARSGV